jgi:hypothetical protein
MGNQSTVFDATFGMRGERAERGDFDERHRRVAMFGAVNDAAE